jgi:hypothetical protein
MAEFGIHWGTVVIMTEFVTEKRGFGVLTRRGARVPKHFLDTVVQAL